MNTDEHCRHSRYAISMMPVLPNCIVHRPVLSASAALVFLVTAITSSAQLALNTAANPTLSVTAIVFAAIASLALAYCLVSLATLATAVEQLRVHLHSMLMGMACVHADQLEHAIRELDELEALARHCGDDSEALDAVGLAAGELTSLRERADDLVAEQRVSSTGPYSSPRAAARIRALAHTICGISRDARVAALLNAHNRTAWLEDQQLEHSTLLLELAERHTRLRNDFSATHPSESVPATSVATLVERIGALERIDTAVANSCPEGLHDHSRPARLPASMLTAYKFTCSDRV